MSRFAWTWYICISMVNLGVNMLGHSHDIAEVMQFTGGYLVASGVAIPVIEFIITSMKEKRGNPPKRKTAKEN